MPEKLLTDRQCRGAKSTGSEVLLSDGGNLYLRVRPTAKDWLFIYRIDGKQPKLGLGSYPDITLSEARDKALEARKLLAEGIDPREHRKAQEAARKASKAVHDATPQTVRELFESWLKRDIRRRRDDGGGEIERSFNKDVLPTIGDLPLSAVRRAHITQLLDKMHERGVTRMIGIVLADLRQMFRFGVTREFLASDPTFGLKKADWGGVSGERDRVLSEAEIRELATALPKSDLIDASKHAIWIMLATLARIGELSKAKWRLVDFAAGIWTIPKEDTKTKVEHVIKLSSFALSHFRALYDMAKADAKEREKEMSDYVFRARHHDGFVSPKSLTKQVGDRQRPTKKAMSKRSPMTDALLLPGGKWTPHDLRRTGATLMGSLGVRPDVIEKCLNHTEQNRMKRVYQRQELRPEMTEAWKILGSRLTILANNSGEPIAEEAVAEAPSSRTGQTDTRQVT